MYYERIIWLLAKHSDGYGGLDRDAFCTKMSGVIEDIVRERFDDGYGAAQEEHEIAAS